MMKKTILLFLICAFSFFISAQQLQQKLIGYQSFQYSGSQYVKKDSTSLLWQGYHPTIDKKIADEVSLGFPKLNDLDEIQPQMITTDLTLSDSLQYTYAWDTLNDVYLKKYRVTISKDTNYKVAHELQEEFDSTLQNWVERQTGTYSYDAQKRLIQAIGSVIVFVYYGDSLVFDQWGRIISTVKKLRNIQTEQLDYFSKYDYTYNSEDQVTKRVYSKWDLYHHRWNEWKRTLYTYSGNKIAQSIFQQWNDIEKTWQSKDSTLWSFDAANQLVARKTWEIDLNGNWALLQQENIAYDANGNITADGHTTYKNGVIIYQDNYTYEVSGGNYISTSFAIWDTVSQQYNNLKKWEFTYGSYGECISAQQKTWSGSSWDVANGDVKYDFYYAMQPKNTLDVTSEVTQANVLLYPNPASNSFYVLSNDEIENVKVVDVSGKIVFDKVLNSKVKWKINTSGWKSGVYVVCITTRKGSTVKKMIVQDK